MRVGGKVVGQQITADGNELGDWLAMISGNPGCEILRRLDASGCGLDGVAGNGNGRSGTAGVGVDQVLLNEDFFRGIGRKQINLIYVGGDGDRFAGGDHQPEVDVALLFVCGDYEPSGGGLKSCRFHDELIRAD